MFRPPFCPHRDCARHAQPEPGFYVRHGHYRAKCRAHSIPRFRCKTCRRTFSRQTFRHDYRDHKPHLNAPLLNLIASGVGIRQSARRLGLSRRATEFKLHKIGRHARRLNLNLRKELGAHASFHFDEFETFETERSTRPLSVPVLIESHSRYLVWAESATIRPRGKLTPRRLQKIARAELRHGERKDRSRRAIQRTLERGARLVPNASIVEFYTDEKSTYPGLARRAFGRRRLVHSMTNSRVARTTWNPLFQVNHEEARMRDLMSRLRRRSWLVSKRRRYLDLALQVHMAYRNLVLARYNEEQASPAQRLGFVPRRLSIQEVLSWGQQWGARSLSPLSNGERNVEDELNRDRPAA